MSAVLVAALALLLAGCGAGDRPNVVVLLVDDGGFADLPTGFRKSDYSMDALGRVVNNGTLVERSYVHNLCSPTRTSLLAGRNAYALGMDHGVIVAGEPYGLEASETTIGDTFTGAGYTSYAYGKWDAGFACERFVPTSRGFHKFYGYYNAAEDYFTHMRTAKARFPNGTVKSMPGYDWHDDEGSQLKPAFDVKGQYSTTLIGMRAAQDIRSHAAAHPDAASRPPLFMYVATQALHGPLEVPDHYINDTECSTVSEVSGRRIFCGMAKALDEAVANITAALEETGELDNTLWAVIGDNGGHTAVGGRNWPLRGEKSSLFEGGFRSAGLLLASRNESIIPPGPRIVPGHRVLFHVSDLRATLAEAAGIPRAEAPGATAPLPPVLSGVSQWRAIVSDTLQGPRNRALLHLDNLPPNPGAAYLRKDGAKLIVGTPTWYAAKEGWFGCDPGAECPTGWTDLAGTVFKPPPYNKSLVWTFNVTLDPTEHFDLTATHWALTSELMAELDVINRTNITQITSKADYRSDPALHGGAWMPWLAECPV